MPIRVSDPQTSFEARLLDNPQNPTGGWTYLRDENEPADGSSIVTGDSYNTCLAKAVEVVKGNQDTDQPDLSDLVIAQVTVTYYDATKQGFNCKSCGKAHSYGTTYCDGCSNDISDLD
jgi:hypothetical protein